MSSVRDRRLARGATVVGAFALVGPVGAAIAVAVVGLMEGGRSSDLPEALLSLTALAYALGAVPLVLVGLLAAWASPHVRETAVWLLVGTLLTLLAAAGMAALLTQSATAPVGLWPLVLSAGLGSGLLSAAVTAKFRPRRGEPEGALGG